MAIIPPTRVATYQVSSWSTTTKPKTITDIPVEDGDILVIEAFTYDNAGADLFATAPTATVTSGGAAYSLTYTARQTHNLSGYCSHKVWTAPITVTSAGITMSVTYGATGHQWGFTVTVYRDHGGVGVSNKANAASGGPSVTLAGCTANSAIHLGNADYSAVTGARTYRTGDAGSFTEDVYVNASQLIGSVGYYPDSGAAGSKTVGISSPATQKYTTIALEILGVEDGGGSGGQEAGRFLLT